MLCPFCPSHKLLKFAETVYDSKFIGNFEGFEGTAGSKGIFFDPVFFHDGRLLGLSSDLAN